MPQSLSEILLHIVFSTKYREPFLTAQIRPNLHAYLAACARNSGCETPRVGGVEDHVHMCLKLGRTITVAGMVEELKTSSSIWIKQQGPNWAKFQWQKGYGAFSISPNHLQSLVAYIDNQEDHHKNISFQDEYRRLLNKYNIQFEEKYVWD